MDFDTSHCFIFVTQCKKLGCKVQAAVLVVKLANGFVINRIGISIMKVYFGGELVLEIEF